MFSQEYFSNYYNLDNLKNELELINLTLDDLQKFKNESDLFYFAVESGLEDLVEHLYVDCNYEYNLTILLSKTEPSKIEGTNIDSSLNFQLTNSGVSNGLKLNYFNKTNIKINKIIARLNYLRKYSKCIIKSRDYIYKFNPKYKENI